ncbi:Iron-sulfur binding protein [Candidatus Zixiibacteriota bacterium]|nr:Iron-sulfur binding protein [candidate division Zixibacteria bacterium]
MSFLILLPVILSSLILGAHFYRSANFGLVLLCVTAPFMLLIRRAWIPRIMQILLFLGAAVWVSTLLTIAKMRLMLGESWLRMAIILGVVALFTAGSALVFQTGRLRRRYQQKAMAVNPSLTAFILTVIILTIVQKVVQPPMLLFERFLPGAGWFEIFLLALYAGWITENMLDIKQSPKWRLRIWSLFSAVFFGQLLIGLLGIDKFLMTGKLHYPIPALIAAGPIFRGDGFFMPILFVATVILVGPAWCSHLCYIGAWDNIASHGRAKPKKMPRWRQPARIAVMVAVIASAIILRLAGVSVTIASILAVTFGLIGVGLMLLWSRRAGVMTHCTAYCPIGPMANWLGKLSPFRIKINDTTCTDCGICHTACRYDALNMADIKNRRPNIACTLCGDCLASCRDNSIEYHFLGLKGASARTLFLVLVISLHAAFLGVARI